MANSIFTFETLLRKMQLDEEKTPFVIWHEVDLFNIHTYPVKIDVPCLFLCWEGEMEIEINLQPYIFYKNHLFCFTIPCACRIVNRSRNFRCVGLLLSKSFWRQLLFSERTLGKIAARDTFIKLTDDERERLVRFHELLCLCADAPRMQDSVSTLLPLIAALFCQIRNICEDREAIAKPVSHSEKILYDFLDSLHANYRHQRRVSFYANELSLTPRHLTTVIRQVSGRNASQWIEEYTILEAQIMLRNSPMTIKEIAYELNFNDQSLFSKYFSRVAGVSPEKYRRSSIKGEGQLLVNP